MDRFIGTIRCRDRVLSFDGRTKIMGILNVTPDSFSDGGNYMDPNRAIDAALQMVKDGASIIDIGGESTRPGAVAVSPEVEIERIVPVIEGIVSRTDAIISIDTYHAQTAEAALRAGAHIINDISGLTEEPSIADVVSRYDAGLILMNTKRSSDFDMKKQIEFALSRGIREDAIITDPGVGFGTTREEDRQLVRNLLDFSMDGKFPVLLALSRKRLVADMLDRTSTPSERDAGSLGLELAGALYGASLVRVHEVKNTVDCFTTFEKLVYGL